MEQEKSSEFPRIVQKFLDEIEGLKRKERGEEDKKERRKRKEKEKEKS